VTDELVSVEEAHQLLRIAKKGLAKGGGAGGASILGHGTHPDQTKTADCQFKPSIISLSDPGSGAFMTPGSGIQDGKKTGSGSGMKNPDHISESLETNFLG
jgi:hypothetical protein